MNIRDLIEFHRGPTGNTTIMQPVYGLSGHALYRGMARTA